MKRYRITFEIELDDEASHPHKWVPDAIIEGLRPNEDVLNWEYKELEDAAAE